MITVTVNDKMQKGYVYDRVAEVGDLPDDFNPTVTPLEMLKLGVFGGKYMTDCRAEFPEEWFAEAKLNPNRYNANLNLFKVRASNNLKYWQDNNYLREEDPRGWFQWYCRFYMGRRITEYDAWQIKRWRNIKRHLTYIRNRFDVTDLKGSPVRRQALLHWGVRVDGTVSYEDLVKAFN